jgi:hypothetical protein
MLAACSGLVACAANTDESEPLGTNAPAVTFEQFKASLFREPNTGVFIVDRDMAIENEKKLLEYYELVYGDARALIIDTTPGHDNKWDSSQARNLTYCVSSDFGSNQAKVIQAMADATAAWEAVANLKWVHVAAEDSRCTSSNSAVLFDVNPVDVNGDYLARSFFPDTGRSDRNVLIDKTAFDSDPSTPQLTVTGILRHELGHTIGFRHEHTRPEAKASQCFEDNNWRALTAYDSASVMHYPQCNGTGDWSLTLTAKDKAGVAQIYPLGDGADGGTGGDDGGTGSGHADHDSGGGSLGKGKSNSYGPYAAIPGSQFLAAITGTGDADLYVKVGSPPTTSSYDCRPYTSSSNETCKLTAPSGSSSANVYVMVRGYAASTYNLSVDYTTP